MDGVWPDGLLDACVTMVPKSGGDAPLGQRPLCMLPVVYRIWASVRLRHLDSFIPWIFVGRLRILRAMHLLGALHGAEASLVSISGLRKLRTAFLFG